MKTVAEIYKLMKGWEQDPCYDLEPYALDPDYQPYGQVILQFIKDKKAYWGNRYKEHEQELKHKICPLQSDTESDINCSTDKCALWNHTNEMCCFRVNNLRE